MSSDKDYKVTFGARIQWAMKQKDVSVEDMAEHYDVTVQSVYRWLRDDPRVNLERLEQLSDYLEKPVWWWFMPEDKKPASDIDRRRDEAFYGKDEYPESIKAMQGEAATLSEERVGYFDFKGRRVDVLLRFIGSGEPAQLGGYNTDDD